MNERTHIFLLCLVALAAGAQSAFAVPPGSSARHTQNSARNDSNSDAQFRSALSGAVENNNGQLRLNLTNRASREFRGVGIIGIGNDSEQGEIGQLALLLPPRETRLYQLSGVYASGKQFSIKIFDRSGTLIFYKIAPIKNVSDSAPATSVTLHPVSKRKTAALPSAASPINVGRTIGATDASPAFAEVTIKGRLLAGQSEADPFSIVFEMTAPRPIRDATMSIALGKFRDRKPVSIHSPRQNLTVEFKLPDQLDGERIGYELTAQNGRVIAKGELEVEELMADDAVTVTDIRTDRASYEPGEPVRLTILLDGKSPNGFRLEAQARDGRGNVIFQDQHQSGADDQTGARGFTVTLPRELTAPVIFEFKIYDSDTGLLFDSGEREIPVKDSKRPPR